MATMRDGMLIVELGPPHLVDLCELLRRAYALSKPGSGSLGMHYQPGPLSDVDAEAIVNSKEYDRRLALHADYVHGRCVKLVVFREPGGLFMRRQWLDHTPDELERLLDDFDPEWEGPVRLEEATA